MSNRYNHRGTVIETSNGAEALLWLADTVLTRGEHRSPRGVDTTELLDVTVMIHDPGDVLLYGTNRRGYHPAIGAAEGLLLLAGVSDPGLLRRIAPAFERFQDGGALHGAYGPRLANQFDLAIKRLQADPSTRQAVMTIWDSMYDLTAPHRTPHDVPCTVYLHFRIVDDSLDLKVHMRSNDLWWGWCYDIVQFTLLQQQMAHVLGYRAGVYTHHVDSLHLYDKDREDAHTLVPRSAQTDITDVHFLGPLDIEASGNNWSDVRKRALTLLYDLDYTAGNETEAWLQKMTR